MPETSYIDALDRIGVTEGTIVLTFADQKFEADVRQRIEEWRSLGVDNYLVATMDEHTHARLIADGVPCLFWPTDVAERREIWIRRVELWKLLVDRGFTVLNVDADAVWLKNPLSLIEVNAVENRRPDIAAAQGTVWPYDVHDKQGFVLRCGFLYFRSSEQTKAFLALLLADVRQSGDDQTSLNHVLLEQYALRWQLVEENTSYKLSYRGRTFTCFHDELWGSAVIGGVHVANRNQSLIVVMLPHRLFPRQHEVGERVDEAYIESFIDK